MSSKAKREENCLKCATTQFCAIACPKIIHFRISANEAHNTGQLHEKQTYPFVATELIVCGSTAKTPSFWNIRCSL